MEQQLSFVESVQTLNSSTREAFPLTLITVPRLDCTMTHKVKSAGLEINSTIRRGEEQEKFDVVDELIRMSVSNAEFYKLDQSSIGVKLHTIFSHLIELLEKSVPVIKVIESFAGVYDFDEHTRGNGYRSFVYIFTCATLHTEKICRYISENRASLLFRKSLYMK